MQGQLGWAVVVGTGLLLLILLQWKGDGQLAEQVKWEAGKEVLSWQRCIWGAGLRAQEASWKQATVEM